MKNIWKKYQSEIISIGYVMAVILLVYFGLLPFERKIKNQADKIQEKTLENEIFEKRITKVSSLESEFNEYQQNRSRMGLFLLEREEIDFIKKIEALGEESESKISLKILEENDKNKKIDIPKDKKTEKEEGGIMEEVPYKNFLSLEIKLEGSYEGLMKFLRKIEKTDYYVDVVSLDLKKTIIEEEVLKNNPQPNLFSSQSDSSAETEKSEKKFLKSTINIIVYKN